MFSKDILKNMSSHNHHISREFEDAFDAIFKQYYQRVEQFVAKFVTDKSDSDEIVQTVFIKVWSNMEKMASIHDLNSYLFVITSNALRDYFRSEKRHSTKVERLTVQHEHEVVSSDDEATETIHARELSYLVNTTVSKMPEKRRRAYMLSREDGKSSEEIAKEMRISKRTVEKHLQIALSQLRRILSKT